MTLNNTLNRLTMGLAGSALILLIATPVWTAETQELTQKGSIKVIDKPVIVDLEEKWGVKIVGVRLTAAGNMLDFRYKVIDPKKAAPILNRKNKPHLIDQTSNQMVKVKNMPKIGSLRQNTKTPKAGRIYFMLFPNPGFIKAQSKVTIVVGEFRAENIIVEG